MSDNRKRTLSCLDHLVPGDGSHSSVPKFKLVTDLLKPCATPQPAYLPARSRVSNKGLLLASRHTLPTSKSRQRATNQAQLYTSIRGTKISARKSRYQLESAGNEKVEVHSKVARLTSKASVGVRRSLQFKPVGTFPVVPQAIHELGYIDEPALPEYLSRMGKVATSAWQLPSQPDCTFCGAARFQFESPGFCCQKGRVVIDVPRMHPRLWDLFVNDVTPLGKEFRRRCRSYNNTMAFSSVFCHQDGALANDKVGAYTVKLNGIISHYIKNLIPKDGFARHAQIYFYGTENELDNRLAQAEDLEKPIVELLLEILKVNPYHNFFMRARELPSQGSFSIVLRGDPALDKNVYNLPVVDHVAAIWHEAGDDVEKRPNDVRVYFKEGGSANINYYYGCYDPLRYLLLYPFGEPGWRRGLTKLPAGDGMSTEEPEELPECMYDPSAASSPTELLDAERAAMNKKTVKRATVSLREYYAFLLQIRRKELMSILRTGRLFQQYVIDMYIKIETQRLDYLRLNQKRNRRERRGETFMEVANIVRSKKKVKGFAVGQRVKLNTSFTGGPRDLRKRYMNALALVNKYGTPDFFLTMTCNPKWIEILCELGPNEQASNRPDLVARVFRAKNEELKRELIKENLLGKVAAYFYVVEFQKRGLPHVHWLLIMEPGYKVTSNVAYDRFVCAEIPDPVTHVHLHDCVKRHMIHGPCGKLKSKNVCMVGGTCKNNYPKQFREYTEHREDSYPAYRRRENNRLVSVRGHELDNRWVVPYNPYLLAKFDCHINLEICADIKSVKYLYKYVCKGSDQVAYNVTDDDATEVIDEIQNYRTARWVCAPEAMWRIYGFELFDMQPPVLQLHVHLPGYHWLTYNGDDDLEDLVAEVTSAKTQLTEFFKMNRKKKVRALNLLYKDFPQYFVWQKKKCCWVKRQQKISVGRLVAVHILDAERFYLRLLLNNVRAPRSFKELRTFEKLEFPTFREAAFRRGLLQSDHYLQKTMLEASGYKMPYALRRFFCIILVNNSPADPRSLWEEFKNDLSSDILLECNDDVERSYCLALENIDTILQSMGQTIDKYQLAPTQIGMTRDELFHKEYLNELHTVPTEDDLNSVALLNSKQRAYFEEIMHSVRSRSGRSFFIDGPGGTGKTFLYKALLAHVRSTVGIALACASSGVAASLLPNGRTAHSRFKLPLKPDESLLCNIKKNTGEAKLIIAASLIIWDEASMANRRHIEALDLLLQDLMGNQLLFGGKTVVLGGDFRQTIPIVTQGTREACVDACLVNSVLWPHIKKLRLTENMRAQEDPEFVDWLMRIGEGRETCIRGDYIQLPLAMCLPYSNEGDPLELLIREIFPSFDVYMNEPSTAINRAILTPKNEDVDYINSVLIERFPGEMKEYFSSNLTNDPKQQGFYQDFLNGINVGGLPPHVLQLKRNCPVMLMRNINPTEGLCNGTRLIIREPGETMLLATIVSGEMTGRDVLIPRITLELEDMKSCPVPFKRFQFPVRLCFAISINKSQGQTLDRVGIYLPAPPFAHGQLYVALSRVRKSAALKVLIKPHTAGMDSVVETRNVVYQEVLSGAT